ncbi:MAG: DUF6265 family protein [Candidatus Acidiferrales bacterium]
MLRTRIGVLLACAALLALLLSSRPGSAQQPAGADSQSKTAPAVVPAAAAPGGPPQTAPTLKLSDFAWLEGRWRGDWGPRVAEQVWMAPKAGVMVGDFRLTESDKILVIEFFTLVEKPGGVNFYFRHFTPELVPWEKSDATVLNLASADAKNFDFENPANGMPKRAIFTRVDADTYTSRSEIVPANGEPQIIEITYHRQPLAATAPNAGAHQKKK